MSQRIAVLGTGANGASIGADLVNADLDVTFIEQWPAHVEKIRADGITVETVHGVETTPIDRVLHLCQVAELKHSFDIVLMVLKAYDTRWGSALIEPYLASDGILVGVQNGMTIDAITDIVGPERAMGAVIEISSTMYDPGYVERHSPKEHSWFAVGGLHPTASAREAEVAEILAHVGTAEISDDIISSKWMKLVVNAAELVTSAILGLPVAEAFRIPEMGDLMRRAGYEAVNAAVVSGSRVVPIFGVEGTEGDRGEDYVDALLDKLLKDYVLDHTTSTVLQDWTRGRHSEVNETNGHVVDTMRAHGLDAPVNAAMVEVALEIERGDRRPHIDNLPHVLETVARLEQ